MARAALTPSLCGAAGVLTSAVAKVRTFPRQHSDGGTVGAATTIVGGSEVDTIGVSTDGIIFGAKSFINGQVGADKIYVRANAAGTVRGGSEADVITVTHGTTALELYGDKGADLITAGNAANTSLVAADLTSMVVQAPTPFLVDKARTPSLAAAEPTPSMVVRKMTPSLAPVQLTPFLVVTELTP